jgi:hypothetical protein
MRWTLAILAALPTVLAGATAADLARAIRENSFDRDQCYRVRDLKLVKEDIRLYFTDGHLIFSKPIEGRRVAAVFAADVEGGDAEVLLFPPDRGERSALAKYIHSPNLDEHFRAAVLLFTGDEYDQLMQQLPDNPANKKAPEVGALLDEQWTPVLRNLGASYQTRFVLELIGGPGRRGDLFADMINSPRLGNFDIVHDPDNPDQIYAGQLATRDNRLYFDTWTSFPSKSARKNPPTEFDTLQTPDYHIDATVAPDLRFSAVARVKVKPVFDGMKAATFDIAAAMDIDKVTVDGKPAEWLQRETLRLSLMRAGNGMFLVIPPEPLRKGREYEFEFHYSGNIIRDAGDRVFYVGGRGNWYPAHSLQFANFDMLFRVPRDLDLVSAGEVVEDRVEGDQHIMRSRTAAPIRLAGFNLGNYEHARVERGGYRVDVVANRALEKALQPRPQPMPSLSNPTRPSRRQGNETLDTVVPTPINPLERLQSLANEVASAMEFMTSKFGPPALPHLTVSPIPGAFGQGFPGLIYLSTLAYLKHVPDRITNRNESQELFFADVLQAHEAAHQWWGNRVSAASYRDYWLMEALANYSALLYVEKTRGGKSVDTMLESYRTALLEKNDEGKTIDSAGPIVLGPRLETSIEPRGWRIITYGKGSWIIHMLRRRMGDERFYAFLAELAQQFDHKRLSTEDFRALAVKNLPPKMPDPSLQGFFEQWIYGTGIPTLKMTYALKGKAPALRVTGTIEQADVDEDFSVLVPVEVQVARGKTVTQWVQTSSAPAQFSVPVTAAPTKVLLDPKHAILRR